MAAASQSGRNTEKKKKQKGGQCRGPGEESQLCGLNMLRPLKRDPCTKYELVNGRKEEPHGSSSLGRVRGRRETTWARGEKERWLRKRSNGGGKLGPREEVNQYFCFRI